MEQLDALALEYQAHYGTAWRNVDVSHFINNPNASGIGRVFGGRLQEQGGDVVVRQLAALFKDGSDPLLVSHDSAKSLP